MNVTELVEPKNPVLKVKASVSEKFCMTEVVAPADTVFEKAFVLALPGGS